MNQIRSVTKKIDFTKRRLLWILIAAAWIFVFLKLLTGAVFEKNTSLVAAFSVTNPDAISATVEVAAKYPEEVWEEKEQKKMLREVADAIGLKIEEEPEITETEHRKEIRYYKDALAADTELKTISLYKVSEPEQDPKQENYIYGKICLNESLETVLAYKILLEETLQELSCAEISTTIQLVGDYAGYLPLERRNEITEDILDALEAEVVYEYKEADLYTIYAYTAGLDNYITVEDKRINVHIAMSQNEDHYRTILYLASPILPDTW